MLVSALKEEFNFEYIFWILDQLVAMKRDQIKDHE